MRSRPRRTCCRPTAQYPRCRVRPQQRVDDYARAKISCEVFASVLIFPDTSFNAANLYSYQYVVMGACISTSTGGSVMYSYNAGTAAVGGVPANGVVLDTWTTSTTCAGTANTLNAYQAPGGPGLTATGAVTYNVYLATLPAVPGTSATTRCGCDARVERSLCSCLLYTTYPPCCAGTSLRRAARRTTAGKCRRATPSTAPHSPPPARPAVPPFLTPSARRAR